MDTNSNTEGIKLFWEKIYEPAIRRAAGLGALSLKADPDQYAKGFLHCDLLIIGGGPSGLLSALNAARSGKKIMLDTAIVAIT